MNLDTAQWTRLLTEAVTKKAPPPTFGPEDMLRMLTADPTAPHKWDDWATDEWSAEQAFHRLGIRLAPFPMSHLNKAEGMAFPNGSIALSPLATNRVRAVCHEIAHILFEHPQTPAYSEQELTGRVMIQEFEAEGAAMLVGFALGENERALDISRAYIQEYLSHPSFGALPTTWEPIMRVAQRILAAGACERAKPNTQKLEREWKQREQEVEKQRQAREREISRFAAKVRWGS